MKLSGGQQYQFNQIKEDIQRELSRSTFPATIFNTVNNISRILNAIHITKGKGWAAAVRDDKGQPIFTPVEQQRYTEVFAPYVSSIVSFFNDKDDLPTYLVQKGGQDTLPPTLSAAAASIPGTIAPLPATIVPSATNLATVAAETAAGTAAGTAIAAADTAVAAAETAAETAVTAAEEIPGLAPSVAPSAAPLAAPAVVPSAAPSVAPVALGSTGKGPSSRKKGKLSKLSDKATGLVSEAMNNFDLSSITPDVLFDKIMSTLKSVNESMNETADAVNLSHDFDDHPDIPLGPTGFMISPRLIIFLIYYFLDVTRVAIGVAGNDTGRKLLSIVVSVLDLVRGDWKKSVLTFMGYFGNSPMLIGSALKTYLIVIQMLSPTLQIKLPYFMYDSLKSIIFGVILSVIQLGAPKPVRDQIDGVLEKLSNVQRDIDAKLNNLNPPLSARPDYLKADFTDLNNLQSILDDPVYICSAEHRNAIDELLASIGKDGAPAVQLLLSLMRYPHTSGMTKYMCDNKAKQSYVDLLIDEGLEREQQMTEDASKAAELGVTTPSAVEPTLTPSLAPAVTPSLTKGGKRVLRIRSKHH